MTSRPTWLVVGVKRKRQKKRNGVHSLPHSSSPSLPPPPPPPVFLCSPRFSMATSLQITSSLCSPVAKASPKPNLHVRSFPSSAAVPPCLVRVSNGSKANMSAGADESAKKSMKMIQMGGPAALALLAAAIIPEIAEAAQPGISPSLKNLLLSVVAGGVVLVAIGGAVAGVSTFDPVQRK